MTNPHLVIEKIKQSVPGATLAALLVGEAAFASDTMAVPGGSIFINGRGQVLIEGKPDERAYRCVKDLVVKERAFESGWESQIYAKCASSITSSPSPKGLGSWAGSYFAAGEELTIGSKGSCVYSATGQQQYFKVGCRVRTSGNTLEVFIEEPLAGAFYPWNWMNRLKPWIVLKYGDAGKLYSQFPQQKAEAGVRVYFKKSG